MATAEPPAALERLNPDGVPRSPASTNVVSASGPVRTIDAGGRNAVGSEDTIGAAGT